jgi:hypothetical protein
MTRMTIPYLRVGPLLLLAGGTLLAGTPAWAALGAAESGIAADQNALHATLAVRATDAYAVHSMSTANGLNVREYVDRSGLVFAIAWDGPVRPDLQQLFGGYYAEYSAALLKIRPLGLHRSLRIETSAMHVELGGHMRAYVGLAYLPAMMPTGVSRDQVR